MGTILRFLFELFFVLLYALPVVRSQVKWATSHIQYAMTCLHILTLLLRLLG